jgi:histidinol phosphatase-like PHP family hydrolase
MAGYKHSKDAVFGYFGDIDSNIAKLKALEFKKFQIKDGMEQKEIMMLLSGLLTTPKVEEYKKVQLKIFETIGRISASIDSVYILAGIEADNPEFAETKDNWKKIRDLAKPMVAAITSSSPSILAVMEAKDLITNVLSALPAIPEH